VIISRLFGKKSRAEGEISLEIKPEKDTISPRAFAKEGWTRTVPRRIHRV
jgi:hypothetical protein